MSGLLLTLALGVLLCVLIAAAVARALGQGGGTGSDAAAGYTRQGPLVSAAERSFLGVLEQAVGGEHRVFAKVRVADVLAVAARKDRASWQRAFNRISAKHFDFVLCDPQTLDVRAAIELDDASHAQGKRQARDAFLTDACRVAGLPLLQVPAKATYTVNGLRSQIAAALAPPPVSAVDIAAAVTAPTDAGVASPPACPKCTSSMVLRMPRRAEAAKVPFWGCSRYPQCRGMREAPPAAG